MSQPDCVVNAVSMCFDIQMKQNQCQAHVALITPSIIAVYRGHNSHQIVQFGGVGEALTIRQDSFDRNSALAVGSGVV